MLLQACGATSARDALPSETSIAAPTLWAAPVVSQTAKPAKVGTPAALMAPVEATSLPSPVTVTAAKGNLFIRRGPDAAFNPVSVLMRGQNAQATARDVLAGWVQIPIPGGAGGSGWISVGTEFTLVSGDVLSLPEIEPTDWPIPAFLRNCTHHEMYVDPGGIVLPPVDNFPENDVRLNPGAYTVRDTDVDGYPQVLAPEIGEGSAIDIQIDGAGEKKKCPLP
jgi:hypothetical protein